MPIILRSVSVVWTVRLIILLVSFWKVMFDVWIEFLTMKAVCPALLSELGAGMYLNFPSLHAISTILFFCGTGFHACFGDECDVNFSEGQLVYYVIYVVSQV